MEQMEKKPKIIKFAPFKGLNNEVLEGKLTKIVLSENTLEYKTKFTQEVTIELEQEKDNIEAKHYCDEEGILSKEGIIGFSKYVQTSYNKELEPYLIHYLDICYSGGTVTLSCNKEDDKSNTYQELIDWKFNNK